MATINEQIQNLKDAIDANDNKAANIALEILKARKLNKAQKEQVDALSAEVETEAHQMSSQLAKYRASYKTGLTASGAKSLHNGDDLASFLEMKTPEQVCSLADWACDEVLGFHEGKYAKLNPGQQRMNAGNKLRARLKKGEFTMDEIRNAK